MGAPVRPALPLNGERGDGHRVGYKGLSHDVDPKTTPHTRLRTASARP